MTVVQETIAAELALVVRKVQEGSGAVGYGRELSCVTDVTPNLDEVDPNTPLGIAQAISRRWITARGTEPSDPEYGEDVYRYLHKGIRDQDLPEIAGRLTNEALKDDRVETIVVDVDFTPKQITINARFTPAGTDQEFRFTFRVTSGEAALEMLAT